MPIHVRSFHSGDSALRDFYWFRLTCTAGLVIVSHESEALESSFSFFLPPHILKRGYHPFLAR